LAESIQKDFPVPDRQIERILEQMQRALRQIEAHRHTISVQSGSIVYHLQSGDLIHQQSRQVAAELQAATLSAALQAGPDGIRHALERAAWQMSLIEVELGEVHSQLEKSYVLLDDELRKLAGCARELQTGQIAEQFTGEQQELISSLLLLAFASHEKLTRAHWGLAILPCLAAAVSRQRSSLLKVHRALGYPVDETLMDKLAPDDDWTPSVRNPADLQGLFAPRRGATAGSAAPGTGADENVELF
jgi:hypothetical protein